VASFASQIDLAPYIGYGLLAMRHRGVKALGYVSDGSSIRRVEVDLDKLDSLSGARGFSAIGCVGVGECCRDCGDFVVCWEGGGEDVCAAAREALRGGGAGLRHTSFVAMSSDGTVAVHRPAELRHLAIGAYGFELAIAATETSAIEVLGGEVRRSLMHGETVIIRRLGVKTVGGSPSGRICTFEFVYLSRLDSEMDGVPVAEIRRELAHRLAERVRAQVDVVVGMPETGASYAAFLGEALGKPTYPALIPTARTRSALLEGLRDRLAAIQLKARPAPALVEGRRVLLVDDSLISGVTVKTASQVLRHRAGAVEVHVAVASPLLAKRCPYGVYMPEETQMLANSGLLDKAEQVLEVDSLAWLDAEDVEEVLRRRGLQPCTECFLRRRA